jgi:hypothetical protein
VQKRDKKLVKCAISSLKFISNFFTWLTILWFTTSIQNANPSETSILSNQKIVSDGLVQVIETILRSEGVAHLTDEYHFFLYSESINISVFTHDTMGQTCKRFSFAILVYRRTTPRVSAPRIQKRLLLSNLHDRAKLQHQLTGNLKNYSKQMCTASTMNQ